MENGRYGPRWLCDDDDDDARKTLSLGAAAVSDQIDAF